MTSDMGTCSPSSTFRRIRCRPLENQSAACTMSRSQSPANSWIASGENSIDAASNTSGPIGWRTRSTSRARMGNCWRSRPTRSKRWRAVRSPSNGWTLNAPRVLFGRGAVDRVGAEAEALGQHVLFVCTPSLKESSHAARVRASLGDRLVAEFSDVAPHVPRESVEAARALGRQMQIDVVVAMGGGSAIGVGKGVALQATLGWTGYEASQASPEAIPRPALIAIPTTYAGSEMTPVVGITDRAEGRKRVQRDPAVLPRLAIYDPEATLDLPAGLTASTGINALAHCVEACYARDVNPVVPPVALEGVRHIARSLPLCVAASDDIEAREDLLLGAYLAGFSIANAAMALQHGLCHRLGGRTGIAHGVVNAIVLPHVMTFNAEAVPDAMSAIAEAMDAGARTRDIGAAPRAVAALVATLPVPKRLRDAGVSEDMLASLAAEAAANPTVQANPKPVTEADLIQLLRSAW